ncbi:MAG: hypothetical protein HQK52_12865 [Oligoflexia bacterium]|nr:hypothetical protein [Oligoflexia bacterium]
MSKKKFSTSTIIGEQEVVPWLAATGALAYTPNNPPDRDYYFQYTWIIPGIFNDKVNKRAQFWFGAGLKDDPTVGDLFDFWNNARKGKITPIYFSLGSTSPQTVTSPIAIYEHKDSALIIQHGSYQFVKLKDHPFLKEGSVLLYRGIGDKPVFRHYLIGNQEVSHQLMNIHSQTLKDSVLSFNAVHSNVVRCESSALNHDTHLLHRYAEDVGGEKVEEMRSILNSGYTLNSYCGERKFGPNHVVFKTPATNIRITTFFCGESEVKVINPDQLEIIKEVGCRVEMFSI